MNCFNWEFEFITSWMKHLMTTILCGNQTFQWKVSVSGREKMSARSNEILSSELPLMQPRAEMTHHSSRNHPEFEDDKLLAKFFSRVNEQAIDATCSNQRWIIVYPKVWTGKKRLENLLHVVNYFVLLEYFMQWKLFFSTHFFAFSYPRRIGIYASSSIWFTRFSINFILGNIHFIHNSIAGNSRKSKANTNKQCVERLVNKYLNVGRFE